jgi:hypothetical protein
MSIVAGRVGLRLNYSSAWLWRAGSSRLGRGHPWIYQGERSNTNCRRDAHRASFQVQLLEQRGTRSRFTLDKLRIY